MTKSCENCGKPFEAPARGRPKRFCSTKCSLRKGFLDREASRRDRSGAYDSSGVVYESRSYDSSSVTYDGGDYGVSKGL